LAAKFGSHESLKVFTRCGLRPCALQIRWMLLRESPAAAAMLRTLQWVAFGGFVCSVVWTTSAIFSAVRGLRRGGRLASFNSPSTPLARKRRRHRRTVSWLLPLAAAIRARRQPFGGQQHDPRPPNHLLGGVAVPDKPFQLITIRRLDRDRLDPAHRRRLACPRLPGNLPSETEH